MEKTSVAYNYPILISSIILQNSKVHMYSYLYKIYPNCLEIILKYCIWILIVYMLN